MIIDVGGILAVAVPVIVMIGGVVVTLMAVRGRQRLKEMAMQERIALIEKGLVPSPESNPAAFESMLGPPRVSPRAVRYRSAGLVLTGVGLALMILLFFVMPRGSRGVAIGVGGALTVLGLTVFGIGSLMPEDYGEGNRRITAPRG
jgi:hypothetical protein